MLELCSLERSSSTIYQPMVHICYRFFIFFLYQFLLFIYTLFLFVCVCFCVRRPSFVGFYRIGPNGRETNNIFLSNCVESERKYGKIVEKKTIFSSCMFSGPAPFFILFWENYILVIPHIFFK